MRDDLPRAVGHTVMKDDWEPPSPYGPHASPIDRFAHLPERTRIWLESLGQRDIEELLDARAFCGAMSKETRKWLMDLKSDDLIEITEAIRFQRNAKTVGKFSRFLVVGALTIFISAVTFGEKVILTFKWLTTGVPK